MVRGLSYLEDLKSLTGRKVDATTDYEYWNSLSETTYATETGFLQHSNTNTDWTTDRVDYVIRKC